MNERQGGAIKGTDDLGARFEEIVKQHHQRIFNFIFYMVGDREQATDLTQETFVKAYASRKGFKRKSSVKTWLSRIAHNLSINWLKRKQIERRIYASLPEEGEENAPIKWEGSDEEMEPSRIVERKEMRELVHRCLDSLPLEAKEVILLRDFEDYSYAEIAEILNCSLEALKSRLHRARLALRDQLKPYLFSREVDEGEGS